MGHWGGIQYMRHERAYSRRQRAVTFAGATRTITIPLEIADFERLERLATKNNVGNATLGRQIIRKYLERQKDEAPGLRPRSQTGGPAGAKSQALREGSTGQVPLPKTIHADGAAEVKVRCGQQILLK